MLLQLPPHTVDLDAATVHGPDGAVELTPTEVALLARLADAGGQPVSRSDLLVDVWGYAPTAQTRTVDTTVRRVRRKIEANPSDPQWLLTVYGQGYRLALRPAPVASLPQVAAQTPRPAGSLVGRADVLAQLDDALSAGALVTLTGPAGMGKTRLALALAARRPAWFVPLADATTAAGIVRRVADVAGVVAEGGGVDPAAAYLGEVLAGRGPRVLVLDNLEQALDAAARCVPVWRAAGLAVLATSQARLALDGEVVVPLTPLSDDDGARLLLDRARALGHWRTVDPEAPVLRALSARLDGLPLALELAAARSNLFAPADLLARMDQALDVLRHGRRDAPSRHGALRAALDWSWGLLEPGHRTALAWLSTVRGGVAPREAVALLVAGGTTELDAEEALHTLVERSWLHVVQEEPVRLGMYEVVRQYADAHLDDRDAARRAHRGVYLPLAEAAAEAGDLARLGREVDNVLAPAPGDEGRIRAILAVDLAFTANGPHHVHEALLEEAVALSEGASAPLRSRALHAWAAMLVHRGDLDRAEEVLRTAGRSATTDEARARVLATEARVQLARGAMDAALERAQQARALATSRRLLASVDLLEGEIHQAAGRPLDAEPACRRAAERAARADLPEREAAARTVLGNVLADLARNDEALASHRAALATYRRLGAERREAAALSNVGNLLVAMDQPAEAMEAYEEVLRIVRRRGQSLDEAVALTNAGCARIRLGQYAEAEVALARSAHIQRRAGVRRGEGIALGNLAIARELSGRGDPSDYTAALDLLEGVDRRASLYFRAYRGGLRLERGEASDDLDVARSLAEGMGDPAAELVIALCAARGGDGVAEALRRAEGAANADVHQARQLLRRLFQV